jgi:hypothetical protein
MKKLSISLMITFLLFNAISYSQSDEQQSDLAKTRVDYAVPEAPAFKILDVEPDAIMRPGNVREVGVSIANFLSNGGAIEISPGLLFAPSSLKDYQSHPFVYRLRVSFSTKSSQYGARDYALGVRMTFIDETDLRTDKLLSDSLVRIGDEIGIKINNFTRDNAELYVVNKAEFDEKLESFLLPLRKKYDKLIVNARQEAKKRNWNKSILELGIAGVASSLDATYKHLLQNRYGVWLTGGLPLFGESGQIVFGGSGFLERGMENKLNQTNGSIAVRGYIGNNWMKGFLGADWTAIKKELPLLRVNVGGEFNVSNGIWIEILVGLSNQKNQLTTLTSSFNIKLATPEL